MITAVVKREELCSQTTLHTVPGGRPTRLGTDPRMITASNSAMHTASTAERLLRSGSSSVRQEGEGALGPRPFIRGQVSEPWGRRPDSSPPSWCAATEQDRLVCRVRARPASGGSFGGSRAAAGQPRSAQEAGTPVAMCRTSLSVEGTSARSASSPKVSPIVLHRMIWLITQYSRNLNSTSAGNPG